MSNRSSPKRASFRACTWALKRFHAWHPHQVIKTRHVDVQPHGIGSRPYRFHLESIIALAPFTSQNSAYPLLHHSWLNQRMVISSTLVKPRAKAKDLFRLATQAAKIIGPVWVAGAQTSRAYPRPPVSHGLALARCHGRANNTCPPAAVRNI